MFEMSLTCVYLAISRFFKNFQNFSYSTERKKPMCAYGQDDLFGRDEFTKRITAWPLATTVEHGPKITKS